MLEVTGVMIFYIFDVFNNRNIDKEKRPKWGIALFFLNILAMQAYWYINIWKPVRNATRTEN